ncbi:MAG: DUF1934 domain-containing protein [Oscillospiraceae bacterium]
MKKDAIIQIKGTQTVGAESDVIEVYTQGTYYKKNGSFYISYLETEETGYEGAKTTLKIDENKKVTMLRSKPAQSQLIIEKGVRHLCSYNTGYDNMMIGIYGNEVESNLDNNGGIMKFKYTMDINCALASVNEVHIIVEECKNNVQSC